MYIMADHVLASFYDITRVAKALNQHPSHSMAYSIGIAEDIGTRRTMEDSHSFVVDLNDIRGQGYFGLFDGHAGKHAAEWRGQHFHEVRPVVP
jgi:protein phosphatase PTC1